MGTGVTAQAEPALQLPVLLLGAPALLGLALALALVLVALVTLRRRRTRGPASPEARQREQDGECPPGEGPTVRAVAGEMGGQGSMGHAEKGGKGCPEGLWLRPLFK